MKLRFRTKDRLEMVKDCYDIDEPVSVVMSPLWDNKSTPRGVNPPSFGEFRRYEFHGEIIDGIPVVVET